jgi:heme/copper-type cytochrome/quinol oxidase subunit 4
MTVLVFEPIRFAAVLIRLVKRSLRRTGIGFVLSTFFTVIGWMYINGIRCRQQKSLTIFSCLFLGMVYD